MTNSRIFIARITGNTKNAGDFYDYDFQEVIYNPLNQSMQNGQLSSGSGLKAVSLGEIGQTMSAPSLADDALVAMLYSAGQVYVIGSAGGLVGLLDVRYSPEDDAFYKTTSAGREEEWAKSTLYPPAAENA